MSTAIRIDGAGYTQASLALHAGNQWAARYYGVLGDALVDTGAMAGDSSFAEPFSQGYDEAARSATQTFDNLITSYANLGRYAFASVENHTRAELASTFGALVVTDAPSMLTNSWYDVVPITIAPSLGGDPSSMPAWANWVLDKVEGFIWPDADLERLRRTGDAWRTAADHLELVAQNADCSVACLCEIRSPEIPLAVNAVSGLAAATRDLGAQLNALGDACSGYADAVEQQREAVLDLLHDLLRDAIIIQGIGFLAGLVSFGSANAGATAINIAKIGAESSRFRAMIEIIRACSVEAQVALKASGTAIVATDVKLRRFVEARMALRGEAGTIELGASGRRGKSFLELHEGGAMKGHTLRKHVGKTDEFLRRRLVQERKHMASTFTDDAAAESSVKRTLDQSRSTLEEWMTAGPQQKLVLHASFDNPVGRVMMRSGMVVPGHRIKIVLVKDAVMPEGYRILTAFVKP